MMANSNSQTFLGASVVGPSHMASGKPNQDARGGFTIGHWTVLAVADGHGGARYVRSDRGSRLAIEAVRAAFFDLTEGGTLDQHSAPALKAGLADLPQAVLRHWRAAVIADLAADPDPTLLGSPLIAYGSTCVAAAFTPGLVLLAQLGDGDILLAPASGPLLRPLRDDEGLVGQQTYSLCLETAEQHFRTALFAGADPLAHPRFAILSTDGLAKSFADEAAFFAAAEGWSQVLASREADEVAADLEGWLAQCTAAGSGDDTTAMMFIDRNAPAHVADASATQSQAPWIEPAAAPFAPVQQKAPTGKIFAAGFLLGAIAGSAAAYFALAKPQPVPQQVNRELNMPAAGAPVSEPGAKPIAIPPMPGLQEESAKPPRDKGAEKDKRSEKEKVPEKDKAPEKEKAKDKADEKRPEKSEPKPEPKPPERTPDKPQDKPPEKSQEKPAERPQEQPQETPL